MSCGWMHELKLHEFQIGVETIHKANVSCHTKQLEIIDEAHTSVFADGLAAYVVTPTAACPRTSRTDYKITSRMFRP